MDAAYIERLRAQLRELIKHFRHTNHRMVARLAIGGHLTYYSLCFIEAHGNYGYAAGFCGFILLIECLIGKDDES